MYCTCILNYVQVSGVVISIFIPIPNDCDVNKAWSSMLNNLYPFNHLYHTMLKILTFYCSNLAIKRACGSWIIFAILSVYVHESVCATTCFHNKSHQNSQNWHPMSCPYLTFVFTNFDYMLHYLGVLYFLISIDRSCPSTALWKWANIIWCHPSSSCLTVIYQDWLRAQNWKDSQSMNWIHFSKVYILIQIIFLMMSMSNKRSQNFKC